jgi:hypothetical protein
MQNSRLMQISRLMQTFLADLHQRDKRTCNWTAALCAGALTDRQREVAREQRLGAARHGVITGTTADASQSAWNAMQCVLAHQLLTSAVTRRLPGRSYTAESWTSSARRCLSVWATALGPAYVRVAVVCSQATQESSHSPQRQAERATPAAADIPADAGAATEPMEAEAAEEAAPQHADACKPAAQQTGTAAAPSAGADAETDAAVAAASAAGQHVADAVDAALSAANKENLGQDGSQPASHHTVTRSGPDATPTHAAKAAPANLAADEVIAATPGSQPSGSQPGSGAKRQRTGKSKGTPRSESGAHPAAKPSTVSPLPASSSPVTPSPKAAGETWNQRCNLSTVLAMYVQA